MRQIINSDWSAGTLITQLRGHLNITYSLKFEFSIQPIDAREKSY